MVLTITCQGVSSIAFWNMPPTPYLWVSITFIIYCKLVDSFGWMPTMHNTVLSFCFIHIQLYFIFIDSAVFICCHLCVAWNFCGTGSRYHLSRTYKTSQIMRQWSRSFTLTTYWHLQLKFGVFTRNTTKTFQSRILVHAIYPTIICILQRKKSTEIL